MANQNFKVKKGLEVGTGTTVSVDGINVTGVITATTFAGDGSALTGVTASGTGVVVQEEGSNIGTAATINFIGSNVTAALSGGIANITVSGGSGGLSNVVEDTTPQLGGNLDLNSKDITGTGNISITGGFNATGVSTFQENVVFQTAASFGDSDKINVGAGNDLQIYHNGTNSFIDNVTGSLSVRGASGNHIRLQALSGEESIVAAANGSVDLYYDNSKKFETTNTGVTVTGTLAATAVTGDGSGLTGLVSDLVNDTTPQLGGDLDGNSKNITGIGTISVNTLTVAGLSTFNNTVLIEGNDKLNFYSSTSQEGQLYATNEYFYINSSASNGAFVQSTGFWTLRSASSGNNWIVANSHPNHNGEVSLFYNGSKKLETTNTGVTVTGTLAATAVTGSGSGLTGLTGASAGTYGASTNTPIITVDSNGRITGISTVATSGAGGGGGISNIVEDTTPQLGGNLDLNSKTINGTGNIDITGYAAVSGVSTFSGIAGFTTHITLPDHAEIQIGGATGGDLKIYHDASHSYVSDEGTGGLYLTGSIVGIKNAAANETGLLFTENGAVQLYHDNALRLATTNTGVSITDNLNVAGIATFQGNVNLGDSDKAIFGAGDDLQIYHDGNNSWISDEGTGSLKIRSVAGQVQILGTGSNDNMAVFTVDGSSELYYDNSKKLETTSSGVTVTGTLAATAVTGDGSGLTGLPAAGITTANTNIQATWAVTSSGSSSYRFTGPGNDAADDNPDLYLVRGQRYRFTNNSGGSHPFQIRSSPGGSAYSTGVTNNGGASGNIDFNVQHDAPERLYYQCTSHSGMVGNIYIVGGSDWRMTDVNTSTAPEIYTTRNVGIGTVNPTDHLHILHTNASGLTFKTTEDHFAQITSDCNRTDSDKHLLAIEGHWNGTPVAEIAFKTGDDTTNKDNGEIIFRTASAAALNGSERLRITSTGKLEAYKGTSTTGKTSGSEAFTVGNGGGNHRFAVYPDGTTVIGGTGDIGNNNIQLTNNGNATFAGTEVKIGDASASIGDDKGAVIIENGALSVMNTVSNTSQIFGLYGNGTQSFKVTTGGEVTISENIKVGTFNSSSSSATGIYGTKDGVLYVQRAGSNQTVFGVFNGTTSTVTIDSDGTIQTDDEITAGAINVSATNITGTQMSNHGIIYAQRVASSSEAVFQGWAGTSKNIELKGNGDASFAGDISFATGKGIDFSNAADTSTGEVVGSSVLDEYEEGTWSPTIGGTATYDIQWGYYVRIGRLVQLWGGLRPNSMGTGNAKEIHGLPYQCINSPGTTYSGGGTIVWCDNSATSFTNTPSIMVDPNAYTARIGLKSSGSTVLQDSHNFWQNNHRANFFITYYAKT